MRRSWLLVLGLGCGLVASCFDAPSADVMFSCDPASAPACPDGYTCESDGCCHRDGSDFSANAGLCRTIGTDGGTDSATSLLTTDSSGTDTSSSSGGTSESGTSTGTSTSTGSTESSSTDATSTDATSTGDDASSSGAGSTDTGSSSTG